MAKITKRYCEGRKSPYQLFWIEDSVRHSRFFETEEARDDFLRLNGHLDKRSFEALLGIDENTISDISYIESIRGNVSFRDMWEFWAKNHKLRRVLTLWDACDEYLRDMRKAEKAKPEHIRHVRRVLEVLVESFGDIRRLYLTANVIMQSAATVALKIDTL